MLDSTPAPLQIGATPLLQTVGLTKRYGTFLANEAIDIDIWPQQIHALLGENGAGKSTLVKIIYGALQPDAGIIRVQGQILAMSSPAVARQHGIAMVFQHFSLFEVMTVEENIALALSPEAGGPGTDLTGLIGSVSTRYGLAIEPRRGSPICRLASASGSRSCERCSRIRSSSSWTSPPRC